MQVKLNKISDGKNKYISVEILGQDKWLEKSFEYTDNDKLETIINLIEVNINKLCKSQKKY